MSDADLIFEGPLLTEIWSCDYHFDEWTTCDATAEVLYRADEGAFDGCPVNGQHIEDEIVDWRNYSPEETIDVDYHCRECDEVFSVNFDFDERGMPSV